MSRMFNAVTTNYLGVATDVAVLAFDNPDAPYSIHFRHRMRGMASGLGGVHMVSKYNGTGFLHRLLPTASGIAYHSFFMVQGSGSSGREITDTKFPIRVGEVHTYGASLTVSDLTNRLYTDGYYCGSITYAGGIFNAGTPWKIGYGAAAGASAAYNGEIQDVCLWADSLSAAEFRALAEGIDPMLVRPSKIVAYWPMNNTMGGSSLLAERDFSSNQNPMAVNGFVGEGELLPPSRRPAIWIPGNPPLAAGVIVSPPVAGTAPVATGTPEVGQTLSTTNGTWTGGTPTSYTYQWQYYQGGLWANIGGATSSTWVVTVAGAVNVGDNIKCVVTASNSGGSANQDSNTLGPVTDISFTGHSAAAAIG